jgi:hypothetical protein
MSHDKPVLKILHGIKGALFYVWQPLLLPLALVVCALWAVLVLPVTMVVATAYGFLDKYVQAGSYESFGAEQESPEYIWKERMWNVLKLLARPIEKILDI